MSCFDLLRSPIPTLPLGWFRCLRCLLLLLCSERPLLWVPLGSTSIPFASARATPGVSAPSGSGGPPPATFAFPPEDPFDPGFQGSAALDPEVLPPPLVPEPVRAEVRRMYSHLVDLFPEVASSPSAAPPPRALLEEFLSSSVAPHQLVFLSWFERVCTAFSGADSLLASLLASGHAESGLLPPRSS